MVPLRCTGRGVVYARTQGDGAKYSRNGPGTDNHCRHGPLPPGDVDNHATLMTQESFGWSIKVSTWEIHQGAGVSAHMVKKTAGIGV